MHIHIHIHTDKEYHITVTNPTDPLGHTSRTVHGPRIPPPLTPRYFEDVGHEVPCEWDCTMPNCLNRVRTYFVAYFGVARELREAGREGRRERE